jgi:hypothetical protein
MNGFSMPGRTGAMLGLVLLLVAAGGCSSPDSGPETADAEAAAAGGRFDQRLVETLERRMADNPVYAAVQRVAPERAAAWHRQVVTAYRSDGLSAAHAANLRISEEMGAGLSAEYAPRASDAALLAFYTEMQAVIAGPLSARPRVCYSFLLGDPGSGIDQTEFAALDAVLGPFSHRLAGLVDGASDEPVAYDADRALAVQMAAADSAASQAGDEALALLGERVPSTEAEYRLACSGMAAYLGAILASEGRLDALRDFAAGPG